jgi:hypothetical protein
VLLLSEGFDLLIGILRDVNVGFFLTLSTEKEALTII